MSQLAQIAYEGVAGAYNKQVEAYNQSLPDRRAAAFINGNHRQISEIFSSDPEMDDQASKELAAITYMIMRDEDLTEEQTRAYNDAFFQHSGYEDITGETSFGFRGTPEQNIQHIRSVIDPAKYKSPIPNALDLHEAKSREEQDLEIYEHLGGDENPVFGSAVVNTPVAYIQPEMTDEDRIARVVTDEARGDYKLYLRSKDTFALNRVYLNRMSPEARDFAAAAVNYGVYNESLYNELEQSDQDLVTAYVQANKKAIPSEFFKRAPQEAAAGFGDIAVGLKNMAVTELETFVNGVANNAQMTGMVDLPMGSKYHFANSGNIEDLREERFRDAHFFRQVSAPKFEDAGFVGETGFMAIRSLPYTLSLMVPKVGLPVAIAAMARNNRDRLVYEEGVDPDTAAVYGLAQSMVEGLSEYVVVGRALAGQRTAVQAFASREFREAFSRASLSFLKSTGENAAQEIGVEFYNALSTSEAKGEMSDADLRGVLQEVGETIPQLIGVSAWYAGFFGAAGGVGAYPAARREEQFRSIVEDNRDFKAMEHGFRKEAREFFESEGRDESWYQSFSINYRMLQNKPEKLKAFLEKSGVKNQQKAEEILEQYDQILETQDRLERSERAAEQSRFAEEERQDAEGMGEAPIRSSDIMFRPRDLHRKFAASGNGPVLNEVATAAEVPASIREAAIAQGANPDLIKGVYDKGTNSIVMVGENLTDADDAMNVWTEEFGHSLNANEGMDDFRKIIDSSGVSVQEMRESLGEGYQGLNDDAVRDEYVSKLNDKVFDGETLDIKEQTVWQRIRDWFAETFGWDTGTAREVMDKAIVRILRSRARRAKAQGEQSRNPLQLDSEQSGDPGELGNVVDADRGEPAGIIDSQTGQTTLFSLKESVEVTPKLVALHNLSRENLVFSDKIGGIPVPSIAVVKSGMAVEGFGEITLIGNRALIDFDRDPVFDGDAYTGRFPELQYKKPSAKIKNQFYEEFNALEEELNGRGFSSEGGFYSDTYRIEEAVIRRPNAADAIHAGRFSRVLQYAFLKENGRVPRAVKKDYRPSSRILGLFPEFDQYVKGIGDSPSGDAAFEWQQNIREEMSQRLRDAMKKESESDSVFIQSEDDLAAMTDQFFDSDGLIRYQFFDDAMRDRASMGKKVFDPHATGDKFQKAIRSKREQYDQFVESFLLRFFDEPKIQVGRKMLPATIGNIVEAMSSRKIKGEEQIGGVTNGMIRALLSDRFVGLDKVRQASTDQIQPREIVDRERDEAARKVDGFVDKVTQFYQYTDSFAAYEDAMVALLNSASGKSLKSALRANGFEGVTENVLSLGREALGALKDAPVPYFEAKPQRAVSLNEFAGAVIPAKSSKETKAILENNGVKFLTYKSESDRLAAVIKMQKRLEKSGNDVRFSLRQEQTPERNAAIVASREILNGFDVTVEDIQRLGDFDEAQAQAILRNASQIAQKTAQEVEDLANVPEVNRRLRANERALYRATVEQSFRSGERRGELFERAQRNLRDRRRADNAARIAARQGLDDDSIENFWEAGKAFLLPSRALPQQRSDKPIAEDDEQTKERSPKSAEAMVALMKYKDGDPKPQLTAEEYVLSLKNEILAHMIEQGDVKAGTSLDKAVQTPEFKEDYRKTAASILNNALDEIAISRDRNAVEKIARDLKNRTQVRTIDREFIKGLLIANTKRVKEDRATLLKDLRKTLKPFTRRPAARVESKDRKAAYRKHEMLHYANRVLNMSVAESEKERRVLNQSAFDFGDQTNEREQAYLEDEAIETQQKLMILDLFEGLSRQEATPAQIARAIEWADQVVADGKSEVEAIAEARKERMDTFVDGLEDGIREAQETITKKPTKGVKNTLDRLGTTVLFLNQRFRDVVRYATGSKGDALRKELDGLAEDVNQATENVEVAMTQDLGRFHEFMEETFGKRHREKLHELMVERDEFAKYSHTGHTALSKSYLLQIIAILEQKYYRKMAETNDYLKKRLEQLDDIRSELEVDELALLEFFRDYYFDKREEISAVVEKITGMPIQNTEVNYMPVKVMGRRAGPDQVFFGVEFIPGFSESRVFHNRRMDESMGVIEMFLQRNDEQNRFIHWGELNTELRGKLTRESTRQLIQDTYGDAYEAGFYRHLSETMANQFFQSANDHGKALQLDQLRAYMAYTRMGFSITSMTRQALGIVNGGFELGLGGGIKDIAKASLTPQGIDDILTVFKSENMQARIGKGYNEAVMNALSVARDGGNIKIKQFLTTAMKVPQFGDRVASAIIGGAVYRKYLNEYADAGLSEPDAKKKALNKIFGMISRTQQSAHIKDRASWLRTNESFVKGLAQFTSAPAQQAAYESAAIREWAADKTNRERQKKLATALFLNHVLIPASQFAVKEVFQSLFDEEDEGVDWDQLFVLMAVGPASGVLFAGLLAESVASGIIKGKWNPFIGGSPMDGPIEDAQAVTLLLRELVTGEEDDYLLAVHEFLMSISPAYSQAEEIVN